MLALIPARLRAAFDIDVVNIALLATLALAAICRLVWVIYYFRKMKGASFRALHVDVFPHAGESNENRDSRNERWFAVATRQEGTLLVVGSISLATWMVLVTADPAPLSKDVSSFSRNLLLFGSITLIAARALFRSAGKEITFIGLESATMIGYTAFILSLASIISDLFSLTGAWIALLIAAGIAVREVMESHQLWSTYK